MPFAEGCEMIAYALDAEHEDRLFLRWVAMYQGQMGFEEFRRELGGGKRDEPVDGRGAEDILKKVREIIG